MYIKLKNLQNLDTTKIPASVFFNIPISTNYTFDKNTHNINSISKHFQKSNWNLYTHMMLNGATDSCFLTIDDQSFKELNSEFLN